MFSRTVYTEKIDDAEAAATALLERAFDGAERRKHTVGILFCYSDMEVAELAAALRRGADFEVIGCTCIASMEREAGFHDMAAALTVLSSDRHPLATAVSEPITPGNADEKTRETYAALRRALGEEPKLVFALPPYLLDIMLDRYTMSLNDEAPGVPVVGGLPSYNSNGDVNATIAEGDMLVDRLVLLGIGGDLRPVFSVQNVTGSDVSRKRKVTRAKDNKVFEVNGQRFTDYLKDIGLPVEKLEKSNTTVTFVSNPLLLESADEAEGEFSFVRTLHGVDLEEGSGTAIGRIPEGAVLSVCSLRRDQIEAAAEEGMRALRHRMAAAESDGYAYSTVLAVSCIGRHLLLLPKNHLEAEKLRDELPKGLTLAGFYSYGEIGPQGERQTRNFAHNESLVLCAF